MYKISVNLKNFRFWDQISHKNMSEKNVEKIKIKTEISIWLSISVPNSSQSEVLQIL